MWHLKPLTVFWMIVDDDVLGMFATLTFVVVLSAPAWSHVVTPMLLNWNVFISPKNCQHDERFGKQNTKSSNTSTD